jgi:protein-tyrosine-phosphatase
MPSILFVCTANICRSPLAVGLFRKIVSERPDHTDWRVESAGTWGLDGEPAADGSRFVMMEKGIDIGPHRARTVTRELLGEFDLILTMEAGQKEALKLEFPEVASRIFQLSEIIGHFFDIPDPIGQPIDRFRKTADELDKIFRSGFSEILRLIGREDG